MAESTNRVILKVDFDGNNAVQSTVALRKAFEELTGERQKLLQKVKEGNALTEKERVQLEVLNAKLNENKRETREVTKAIDDSLKIRKAENGSIAANRAELSKLTAEYIKTGKPTEQQTARIKALSDTLKTQEKAIGDNRRNVGNYAEALGGLGGPIGGAITGVKGFNTALSANPIGAVIGLLIPLGNALLKLKPVADFLEAAFAGLNAAFSSIVGSVGKFLSGDFSGAFADFGKNVSVAFNETKKLTTATQQLEDAERNVQTTISANQTKIDQLLLQSKNRSLSEKERVALIEQASKIEEENLQLQLKNANEAKRIIDEKNKLAAKNGELQDEQEQQAIDAQLRIDELNRNSIVLQEKIQNRKDALLDAADLKAKKSQEENIKLQEKRIKAEEDALKAADKRVKDFIDLSKKEFDDTNKLTKQKFDQEQLINKESYANQLITKEEFEAETKRIQLESLNEQLLNLQDYAGTVPGLQLEIASKEIEIANFKADGIIAANDKQAISDQQLADKEIAITNARLDIAKALVSGVGTLLSQDEAQRKRFGNALKALAIAEIAINLQQELAAISLYAAKNPANAVTFGAAGGLTFTANSIIAIIKAGVATALVAKQQFKDGGGYGYTGDGNPSEVSTNLGIKPYTYHKKEYIVPDKVLSTPQGARYVGMLEAMRKSTPGSLAYLGGYADGGFTQRALAQNVDQQIQAAELQRAFQNMPTPVVRVTEIDRVSRNREQSINVSDL